MGKRGRSLRQLFCRGVRSPSPTWWFFFIFTFTPGLMSPPTSANFSLNLLFASCFTTFFSSFRKSRACICLLLYSYRRIFSILSPAVSVCVPYPSAGKQCGRRLCGSVLSAVPPADGVFLSSVCCISFSAVHFSFISCLIFPFAECPGGPVRYG